MDPEQRTHNAHEAVLQGRERERNTTLDIEERQCSWASRAPLSTQH
jgi:hypothetical protein